MAVPRFRNHEIIRQFNGLKRLFRDFETRVSRQRIADLRAICATPPERRRDLAFDILGSVNFGQAQTSSDTDLVIYTRCPNQKRDCEPADCTGDSTADCTFTRLVASIKRSLPYRIEVVDCLDLNAVERDIANRSVDSGILLRFGFYRSICRSVNGRLLRHFEMRLSQDATLCEQIESSLTGCFFGLIGSSQHSYSFQKYTERVRAEGYNITPGMAEKIREYLSQRQP